LLAEAKGFNQSMGSSMRAIRLLGCLLAMLWVGAALGADDAARAIRKEADRVLAAIRDHDAQALGRSMSPYMLEQADPQHLLDVMRERRMHELTKVRWNEARRSDVIARLEGMGTLSNGARRWLNMRFVKRDEGWRLALVGVESAEVIDEPAALQLPSSENVEALLEGVMQAFVAGVRARRFDRLYGLMPSHIGEQFSLQEMNVRLLKAIKRQDYAEALAMKPTLTSPAAIEENGLLALQGHYPTSPLIRFRHKFQYEHGDWRLLHFSIDPAED
jgi:hypothetical protein